MQLFLNARGRHERSELNSSLSSAEEGAAEEVAANSKKSVT